MPLDQEENIDEKIVSKVKKVSSTKSIFDEKKSSLNSDVFEKKVDQIKEKSNSYKERAAELAVQFKKILEDKTLPQNKSSFAISLEKEILTKMIELAIEINNDENEKEGMGSLSWITFILKLSLSQRDKINVLEYSLNKLGAEINKINAILNNK